MAMVTPTLTLEPKPDKTKRKWQNVNANSDVRSSDLSFG